MKKKNTASLLWSVRETAAFLGISESALYRAARRGDLSREGL
jgi:predicted DNA-binding transcriptional regulator AlpA